MKFKFYNKLILRTPALPLGKFDESERLLFINNTNYKNALFIASPDLYYSYYRATESHDKGRQERSLAKYFNRMSFRCTPFGLFAGCSIVDWDNETNVIIADNYNFRIRLDKDYLNKIVKKMLEYDLFFLSVSLKVNNTIYRIGGQIRYVEMDNMNNFTIAMLPGDPSLLYFLRLVKKSGGNIPAIIELARNKGYAKNDVISYLKELYKLQIITTNLNSISQDYIFKEINKHLNLLLSNDRESPFLPWKKLLEDLSKITAKRKDILLNELPEKLELILKQNLRLGIKQRSNQLLQVDYFTKPEVGKINKAIQKTLLKAIDILGRLCSTYNNSPLSVFTKRFYERFETQEIPLLTALDPEMGIDYIEGTSSFDPFLNNEIQIELNRKRIGNVDLTDNQKSLMNLFNNALDNGDSIIFLTDELLNDFDDNKENVPPITSVIFRVFDGDYVQLISYGGSSGINMFSRFSDVDEEVEGMINELLNIEEVQYPERILAEVVHEPTSRSGNVIGATSKRKYEIPYCTNTNYNEKQTIDLSDIYISHAGNKLVLRSKKHGRLIIPRLSHAFNYLKGSPIYRFLGDFQNQQYYSIKFDFKTIIPGKSFYPRLIYKNVVLFPATWYISSKGMTGLSSHSNLESIRQYLKKIKICQLFIISEGDNELLIDWNNDEDLEIFLQHLKANNEFYVKEFHYNASNHKIKNASGQPLNNELIAILLKDDKKENAIQYKAIQPIPGYQRKFGLGTEWIYFKIYCGKINADKILAQYLHKIISSLNEQKLIDYFFFIRYQDPEPHIRFRIKLARLELLSEVIAITMKTLNALQASGLIWRVQTDTYNRELERYGEAVTLSEQLFATDSMSLMKLLRIENIRVNSDIRISIGVRLIDDFLNCFLRKEEKLSFVENGGSMLRQSISLAYKQEKNINQHCREHWDLYDHFLTNRDLKYECILKKRQKNVKNIAVKILDMSSNGHLSLSVPNLLSSYVHMSINRLFSDNQKIYEFIIYNFLFKYYNKQNKIKG
ncbi:lantibiotic dehydratase [Mucilaginibacter sp.]